MPTPTYTPLANITLGSSAASVTFSSITAYRDYILIIAGTASGNANIKTNFNSDTGSNYSDVYAYGNGSSTGSGTVATTYLSQTTLKTDQSVVQMQIMDASATDKHKTVLMRSGSAGTEVKMAAGRWASTSAITTIGLSLEGGNTFSTGTSFALYGIAS
jgi:hypothetical protein